MRGGVTWEEAMDQMSFLERKESFAFVDERLKKIKDHAYPVY